MQPHMPTFAFVVCVITKKSLPKSVLRRISLSFLLWFLGLTSKSLIPFEFVQNVREGSKFVILHADIVFLAAFIEEITLSLLYNTWDLWGRSVDWICMSLFLWCLFCFIDLYVFFMPVLYCFDGEGNGDPLQCSCLGNPMDRGAWQAAVHGVAKSWTGLCNWTTVLKTVIL